MPSLKLHERKSSSPLKLGPGPSPVASSVIQAAEWNPEHMNSDFLEVCDNLNSRLRIIFGTSNEVTFTGFGTGSNGIETMISNCLEAGQKIIIISNGVFGGRAKEMSDCYSIETEVIQFSFGSALDLNLIEETLKNNSDASAVFFVLAETSNGINAPGPEISGLCKKYCKDALILIDAVTAIAGLPIEVDKNGYDVVSSGSQKCLSVPTGLFPITYSEKALNRIKNRKTPIPCWSHNPLRVAQYLGQTGKNEPRRYITTAETTLVCQMAESTALILDEGLENVFQRHKNCGKAFRAAVTKLGITPRAPEKQALPMLHPLLLKSEFNPTEIRKFSFNKGVSFGGGLGEWKDDTIRVGLMGHGAKKENVFIAIKTLAGALGVDYAQAINAAKSILV